MWLQVWTSLYPRRPMSDRALRTKRGTGLLFCASQALLFACLSLLQIAPGRLFLPLLVAMHAGIALFVKTKRDLLRAHSDAKRIVRATHVLMALYLPVLIYKILGHLRVVQAHVSLLQATTLGLSILAASLVAYSLRATQAAGST